MAGRRERPASVELWEQKLRAEVEAAESLVPGVDRAASSSPSYSPVLVVKGKPSAADVAAGRAFAGEDGTAIRKALEALGLPDEPFLVVSRPSRDAERDPSAVARRLRMLAQAVEAEIVLAVDPVAAADVAKAFGVEALEPGVPVDVRGFRLLATDDFAAALAHQGSKRAVWAQIRTLAHGGASRG